MMDFLKTLLIMPEPLSWLLVCVASLVLLAFAWLIAYFVAFIHAHAGASWRELLVSTTRVKISWIWGWTVSCFVLLVYVLTLGFLARIASFLAVLPFFIAALITLAIAAWLRHAVRAKVVRMQKLVQGGR